MNKLCITLFSLAFLAGCSQRQIPNVMSGRIVRIENFQSKYINPRNIDIWLPDNYSKNTKYAVLYMHDGQMLFDPKTTWNNQAWAVDDVASKLIKSGSIKSLIVVGIWNDGKNRHSDYFPQKPFEKLTQSEKDTANIQLKKAGRTRSIFVPKSNDYLKFIVTELKPFIDKEYSVYEDKANTFIAGSSMGGLISLYAICEYPDIFGGAACLSTHWPGALNLENNPLPNAFIKYMKENLPNPQNHKIYFDCGDRTLDAMYPPIQKRVDSVMVEKGFTKTSWLTMYFPGDEHDEISWSRRLHIPLNFLFNSY